MSELVVSPGQWPPPRGRRPASGEWPALSARDLRGLQLAEAAAVDMHRSLLEQLEANRRAKRRSLRGWAAKPMRPNTFLDVMAGSVWPAYLTLHVMAARLGLAIRVQLDEPLPRRSDKFHVERGARRRRDLQQYKANRASAAADWGQTDQKYLLWQLEYVRRSKNVTAVSLHRSCGISLNTVTRLAAGPSRGQAVSYPVILALCHELGARLELVSSNLPPTFVWDSHAGLAPAVSSFPVTVTNIRDR